MIVAFDGVVNSDGVNVANQRYHTSPGWPVGATGSAGVARQCAFTCVGDRLRMKT